MLIGSAIYAGRWMKVARQFVNTHQETLRQRPVWLFSSGPVGEAPDDPLQPEERAELLRRSGARRHQLFNGRLDTKDLGTGERLMVRAVKAPTGDFRDWRSIGAWAAVVAKELLQETTT